MAAENPVESPQGEATCPICLEYFKDPVIIECGHNFCRACIAQCWEGSDTATSCPQLNRQLANMVEIAKGLSLQVAKGAGGDGVCGEHQEALKLFCERDQTPICVICNRSRAHRAHKVVPIEEAAQEYKLQAGLGESAVFRLEKGKLQAVERQKIVSEFQQLRQFLEEQERLLLAQLEKLDKVFVKIQNEKITKLSEEISYLSELISELEGKYQKPASEFLQSLDYTEEPWTLHLPWVVHPGERGPGLEAVLRSPRNPPRTVNMTLDPDSAHPQLVLSEDRKSVRWGDTRQDLPNNPERFDSWACVLGYKGFTSGRRCWEVQVGAGRHWALGVARESVGRKGRISRSPEWGIWAVQRWGSRFEALTSAVTRLPRRQVPTRIRVCLDCDWGQVTFIDAVDETPIFSFPPGSALGERIRPWLWVGPGSPLRLCP
uniref:Zinc finger protein RFP n=1 Tax=Chrysemys picta bellii TaxID=8478 RepID=A0A8C3HA03_CHRPI